MSIPPSTPTPHAMIPRDGWYDGPHVCTFMQSAHITGQIYTNSRDCYDNTRFAEAGAAPLWIGKCSDMEHSKKLVEEYFQRNGVGAA